MYAKSVLFLTNFNVNKKMNYHFKKALNFIYKKVKLIISVNNFKNKEFDGHVLIVMKLYLPRVLTSYALFTKIKRLYNVQ